MTAEAKIIQTLSISKSRAYVRIVKVSTAQSTRHFDAHGAQDGNHGKNHAPENAIHHAELLSGNAFINRIDDPPNGGYKKNDGARVKESDHRRWQYVVPMIRSAAVKRGWHLR